MSRRQTRLLLFLSTSSRALKQLIHPFSFLGILLLFDYVVVKIEEFVLIALSVIQWFNRFWPLIIILRRLLLLIFLILLGVHLTGLARDVKTHILVAHAMSVQGDVVDAAWGLSLGLPQAGGHALAAHQQLLGLVQLRLMNTRHFGGTLVDFLGGVKLRVILWLHLGMRGLAPVGGFGLHFAGTVERWLELSLVLVDLRARLVACAHRRPGSAFVLKFGLQW